MGLGGVAIAVLPSVVYPQTVVLGQAGGVNLPNTFFFISLHPVSGQQHSWHKLCFE